MNQCNFIGNLGADPETNFTQSGNNVTNFTVAVSEKWKDKNGQQQELTEWVRCIAWRRLGEVCAEYLSKGSKVYVSGKMQTREWEKDGVKRYTTEIVLNSMEMLGGKGGSGGGQHAPPEQTTGEDVPF